MIDRIDLFVPDGGPHGLGLIQGSKAVRPEEWFFKAHFHQDPVMPGSLGLESLLQLLKVHAAVEPLAGWTGHALRVDARREASLALSRPGDSRRNRQVQVQAVLTACDEARRQVSANGFLLVDGRVIYQMKDFTLARTDERSHEVFARIYRFHRLRAAARGGYLPRAGSPAAPVVPGAAPARGATRSADRHRGTALVGAGLSAVGRGGASGAQGPGTVQRPARGHRGTDLCGRVPGKLRACHGLPRRFVPGHSAPYGLRPEQRLPGRPQRHRGTGEPHRAGADQGGPGGLVRDGPRDQRHDDRAHVAGSRHGSVQDVGGHADGRFGGGGGAGYRWLVRP